MKSVSLKTVFYSFALVTLLVCSAAAAPRTPDDLIETDCAGDNQTASSVLIAYDTIHGTTAEVAEAIGEDLCDMGLVRLRNPADGRVVGRNVTPRKNPRSLV